MSRRDPRVDAYIAGAAEPLRPLLETLRERVHMAFPEAEEAIKWNVPHFVVAGTTLAGMSAFKAHCALGVHGDAMSRRFIRIECAADVPGTEDLASMLAEALARRGEGARAPRQPRPELPVPSDFAAALAQCAPALSTFEGFPPGQRREYLEWIAEAKRPATRARRIAQSVEWLAEGKRRNWKYEKR